MPANIARLKAKKAKSASAKQQRKAFPSAESEPEISLPPAHDWRTTDEDEINRRRLRAREEAFNIRNSDARLPVFCMFAVGSGSGLTYGVEIRDVAGRRLSGFGERDGWHVERPNGLPFLKPLKINLTMNPEDLQ